MYAYYSRYDPNFSLHQDDIDGIQYLYGEYLGLRSLLPAPWKQGPVSPAPLNVFLSPLRLCWLPRSLQINGPSLQIPKPLVELQYYSSVYRRSTTRPDFLFILLRQKFRQFEKEENERKDSLVEVDQKAFWNVVSFRRKTKRGNSVRRQSG